MNNPENEPQSPIGLDVGTSRIVAARRAAEGFAYESQLNAFVSVPHTGLTAAALTQERVPHVVQGPAIMVHGNESQRFADLLHQEVRRPMTRGAINPDEPDGFQVIRQIATALLGAAQNRPKLVFTVPGPPLSGDPDMAYHENTLRQLFTEMGFEASSLNEGLAVIYSELADTNYTGIGVSCGGGLCNVCLAYLSVPVLSFSIPKAGDFIDSSAAAVLGEPANGVRLMKEDSFYLNGTSNGQFSQVLTSYYDEMIRALVYGMKEAFAAHLKTPRLGRPVPLVLSGGSALPKGFRERFERILRESGFAIPLSEVRLAADPLTSTAKGALVAAMS
jgi:hypothetical protein